MNKKQNLIYITAFLLIIILCVICIFYSRRSTTQEVAEIYLNGTLVETVYWTTLEEEIHIPVGEGNIVAADCSGVWMEWADCPDQLCRKQGKIQNGRFSIVCLPNRVTVALRSAGREVDGVSG